MLGSLADTTLDLVASVATLAGVWVAIWALLSRFHPDRQFWHDAWAGTRLVESKAN